MDRSIFNIFDTDGDGVVVDCSRKTLIKDIADDQFKDVSRIVEYNAVEGWSRDCSIAIATYVLELVDKRGEPCPDYLVNFLESNLKGFFARAVA